MPFGEPWRNYEEGDFIFGLSEEVTKFQKSNGVKKATPSGGVVTVRQISIDRQKVETDFSDERQELNCAYLDALEHHPKYHNAFAIQSPSAGSPASNAQFRLKSKVGLNFCVSSGRYLHFMLDGMGDFSTVINKNFSKKIGNPNNEYKTSADDKIRTVTGAELRWLYRNRYRVEVQTYVQFWYKGQQSCPPWEVGFQGAADWNAYNPTHLVI